MLRGILTVGSWTMVSRVLGLIRDMLLAALLGAGPVADAFFIALKLPNLFRRLFGEGAFNAAFVPVFSGMLAVEGPELARAFAEEALSVLAFWLLGLTLVGELFMPQVMTVLAPGFAADPAKFQLAVDLGRITFPYVLLICVAALVAGVLNGLEKFAAASAAYVMFNAVGIASIFCLAPFTPTIGHALAWGVTASGIAQLALLMWASARSGMALRLPRPRLTPRMRLLLRRMAPGLVGAGVTQLNLAVDMVIGSLLPAGTVSLLYYADRINQLPLGVIGAAVGTALLPLLSRQVRSGDEAEGLATQNRAIEYALILTIPAALALAVGGEPIMRVLFGRGEFTAGSVRLSAQSLAAYAIGLPAFVMVKVLAPGFFARGDMSTPVRISMAVLVLNLALNLLLMGPLEHIGPPLATSLASIANAAILWWILRRRDFVQVDKRLARALPRICAAAVAMAGSLWVTERLVFVPLDQAGLRWLGLVLIVSLGLAAYGVVGEAVGAFRLRDLVRPLRRRAAAIG